MMKVQLIILVCVTTFCSAVRQQIGFYTQTDCTGDGLLLESEQPDMTTFNPSIVANSKSRSVIGLWGIYKGVNYNNSETTENSLTGGSESRTCINNTQANLAESTRYLGPPDTSTHSISFYEISHHRGRELTISGPASSNIPFTPKSLFTTGNTSWTLYSGSDFDGTATCLTPTTWNGWYYWIRELNSTLSDVKSILRGCDRHIDYYVHGNIEPEDILIT